MTNKKTENISKYFLVNPVMHGEVKPIYKGKNELEAANLAYEEMSKNFKGNTPEFFTLQKINNKSDLGNASFNDFYSFKFTEKEELKIIKQYHLI